VEHFICAAVEADAWGGVLWILVIIILIFYFNGQRKE